MLAIQDHLKMNLISYVISGNTCRHLEDSIYVDKIVGELKDETPSPIFYYTQQDMADSEYRSFREDIDTFRRQIICLDYTRKMESYLLFFLSLVESKNR